MNKSLKIFIIQFLCFALIFLAARFLIVHFELFTGLLIPAISGAAAILLAPQFKIFKINGVETVFVAWLFIKKGTPVKWL